MKKRPLQLGPAPVREAAPTPAQALVLAELDRRGPATVGEVTAATGQHGNTVREHLDALVDLGLVTRAPVSDGGRGRPSYRYAVRPSAAQHPLSALIGALAGVLRETSDVPVAAARRLGRTSGAAQPKALAPGAPEVGIDRLAMLLTERGFDATRRPDGALQLRTCPLIDLARADPEVVCGFHQGLLDRLAEHLDLAGARLHAFAEPGACIVTLNPQKNPNRKGKPMSDTEIPDRSLPITESAHGHDCGCHEVDEQLPELDARVIPHAIRHGSVFGAVGQLRPGQAMVLVAPHNPLPLLKQLADREGDAIEVSYLQEGPDAWRLKLARVR